MNERIKELAEQAVKSVDIVTGNETQDDELAKMYIPDCFTEKFAELIVKECMDCALWVGEINRQSVEPIHTAHAINQRIKTYLGIKE